MTEKIRLARTRRRARRSPPGLVLAASFSSLMLNKGRFVSL
jgi:hypothetical protein